MFTANQDSVRLSSLARVDNMQQPSQVLSQLQLAATPVDVQPIINPVATDQTAIALRDIGITSGQYPDVVLPNVESKIVPDPLNAVRKKPSLKVRIIDFDSPSSSYFTNTITSQDCRIDNDLIIGVISSNTFSPTVNSTSIVPSISCAATSLLS